MVEALTVCVGNFSGGAGAHHAGRFGNRRAVRRHQHAGDAVVGAHAGEIVLHHSDNRGLARRMARVQIVDRRLFETKRLAPVTASM